MRRLIFILPIFFVLSAKAQPKYDTTYIESYYDKLVVTVAAQSDNSAITIDGYDNSEYVLETNRPGNIGIALDYKWFTLEVGGFSKYMVSDPYRGETESFRIRFGFTGRRWLFHNFLQYYQGYHLSNPEDWHPDWTRGDLYPLRPDISNFTYYASLMHNFNPRKFSNMASLWQLERQKKSAGALMVGGSLLLTGTASDSSLVLPQHQASFGQLAQAQQVTKMVLMFNVGYVYTYVPTGNWFLSGALIPGLGSTMGSYSMLDESENRALPSSLTVQTELRLTGGYNGPKFYSGLMVRAFGFSYLNNDETPINSTFETVRLYAGYRFDIPKIEFLKKIGL